jgi:hypothetical protein
LQKKYVAAQYTARKGCGQAGGTTREERDMLWTIAVILLVLWALGLVTSFTMGGFIHLLLVLAIIAVLVRVIQGQRPIP